MPTHARLQFGIIGVVAPAGDLDVHRLVEFVHRLDLRHNGTAEERMPFELQRDDERRLLIVRATGTLSPSEIAQFIRTQRTGALARYRLLFDATDATIRARPSDLDLWVDTVREVVRREGLRPPVALVANTDPLYSFFQTYAHRCRDELDVRVIQVFRRFEPARAWLDQV